MLAYLNQVSSLCFDNQVNISYEQNVVLCSTSQQNVQLM
jgi:hypothetical protein